MLYQKIVDYFMGAIEKGDILSGEKLPSLRKIADQFDVSLSTAVEAYRKLELFGFVAVKDRSGYFARLPLQSETILKPSKKFKSKISEIEHIEEIIEIHTQTLDPSTAPFGVGTPCPEKFPHKMLNRYLSQTIKHNTEILGTYLFGMGLPELRSELARWMKPWLGIVNKDNILITNGCLEAINIALTAECETGDIVAIESPCYFGILQAIHHHGLRALEIKTDPETGVDPKALEELAKKNNIKAFISTPNAQNPLGFSMTDKNKKEVLAICKKHNMVLIEDDLYGELAFSKKRPKGYKYFDKDGIVVHCSSFSKFLGPGLRIGWCIPPKNPTRYLKYKLSLNLCTNTLVQYAVSAILRSENLLSVGKKLTEYYQNNLQIYANVIQNELGEKVSISNPTGSYFLWVRVEGLDSLAVYQKAKKQKISFAPGTLFSATKLYNNYLRVNCAQEFNEERHEQLISLCKIINNSIS